MQFHPPGEGRRASSSGPPSGPSEVPTFAIRPTNMRSSVRIWPGCPPRTYRKEHVRVAGATEQQYGRRIARWMNPDENLRPWRGGAQLTVADRRVGAQPCIEDHQATVRQSRCSGIGLLALQLLDRRRPGRRGGIHQPARPAYRMASVWPAIWCRTTWASIHPGHRAPGVVHLAAGCPYPAYSFNGPDLSHDGRVEIKIEDHYFEQSDAAVVFRRRDRSSGETRYIYHGNDGTSFPWNDTRSLTT